MLNKNQAREIAIEYCHKRFGYEGTLSIEELVDGIINTLEFVGESEFDSKEDVEAIFHDMTMDVFTID